MSAVATSHEVLGQFQARMRHGAHALLSHLLGLSRSLFSTLQQSIASTHQTYRLFPKSVLQVAYVATLTAQPLGIFLSSSLAFLCATAGRKTQYHTQHNSLVFLLSSSQQVIF